MAVYTDVAADELAEFLSDYDIGELLSYKGIAEGVENSNFLLHTTKGAYILTLYEKRVAVDDLPYFLSLMAHLAERGVRCPQPAKNRKGEVYSELAGRPAAIINFLEGIKSLGITAGASAPEVIVEEIMGAFAERYELHVETVSAAEENEFFPLPRSLRPDAA